ncbi:MAG: VirB3 family type IV secretion system protein [Neisseriaceae bacterium]|nr:VirB3 family type IV secretion system protein [Neisseriaceae bacterium]MBQ9260470.1 VirB3 family type IV secretion system protein [Neisseriaceae bacterium]MBQ9724478.1 VirB3 family type IV secretion system protein [Neisseriaceae bacterium]MBR1818617.1 VirB3 family type IV secretion system protein [Neisseriaceae bacterium]
MSEEYETHPLFRGATKPRMFFGVPLMEFGGVATVCILAGMWSKILSGSLTVGAGIAIVPMAIVFFIMRDWTKRDDQYVKMFVQKTRESVATRQCKIDGITIITPKPVRHRRFVEW